MTTETNKIILHALQSLGLSELEVNCYISLLHKSPQRVTNLAKEFERPRATIHLALAHLVNDYGIVSKSKKKRSFEFSVEDPQELITILDQQQRDIDRRKKRIEQLLPELRAQQQFDATKPQILYVEGVAGMKKVFLDVIEEADEIIGYGSNEDDYKYLPELFPEYYEQRVKKKIPVKAIIPATEFNIRETVGKELTHQRYTHLIPKEFNFPIQINIYRDKTVIFSLEEKFVFVIRNKAITQCLKMVFSLAYESARESDKKIREGYKDT